MNTRRIANLDVAPIGLGAMPLSIYERPDEAEAVRVIHAALDAGMTLIDTADIYCPGPDDLGHNERLIARALRERSSNERVLVATKGGLEHHRDGSFPFNAAPEHLERACEASLRALGVECIDLYQLHAPDPAVPFAESIGVLDKLRRAGKVRHIGLSNVSLRQLVEAEALVPVVSVQNCLSPHDREDFTCGVLAHCEARGIAYIAYGPVCGRLGKARIAANQPLCRVGERHGASPFQVALAWLLARSPVVIPIPGARRIRTALDSAAAMHLRLDAQDMAELNAAFPTP
ncbi:aldo/keto reductase [Corallococcus carmarthensis]|uniref:Aldo/keto reductase n=1 Tax=Corallococcus carmarthensis TaxID=2316728 RepID=A0A3A8K5N7_9BACT|nr:aldo/keto reductase [Corallococcus carmarthensis]RKG99460.1 aldo/keto reductase [Corallococcus carmarthensis]